MNKEFVSTKKAANELGVHQTTVQRWIRDGYLKARKVGPGRNSPYRVEKESLKALTKQLEN